MDPLALKLETRQHRWIRNAMRPQEHPTLIRGRIAHIQATFRSIEVVSACTVYNCYGMVFASRRSAILYEEDVEAILKDDKYTILPWHPASWKIGDVVIYRDKSGVVQHVGLVAEKDSDLRTGNIAVKVLSTWGQDGEYLHPIDGVPILLGVASEVRSQRFL